MSFWRRFMSAAQAGISAFRQEWFVPVEELGWNMVEARDFRYSQADLYYANVVYRNLAAYSGLAAQHKIDNDLYTHIRGIRNPYFRLVEAYVAKVYGGQIDYKRSLNGGAIPIAEASDELRVALRQVMLWSNWGSQKSVYVRTGAKMGDSLLKIVDDSDREKVRMEVLHPAKLREKEVDAAGNIVKALIEYDAQEEDPKAFTPKRTAVATPKTYLYSEIIQKLDDGQVLFQFYKNGKVWDYVNNIAAGEFAEYTVPYGFVPLVQTQHRDEGLDWGGGAVPANALPKIDEINDQASVLDDQIRKAVNVIFYYAGAQASEVIEASVDDKDETPALFGPVDSRPHPLLADINIADASANILHLLEELEADMPELALHRMRGLTQPTAPGIRSMFSDAIDRFIEAQGNYDDGLIRALQMAVSIGAWRKYDDFAAFNLDSFDRGDLNFFIETRPVIEDQLTKQEKIGFLRDSSAPNHAIWRELNVPDQTIKEWENEAEAREEEQEVQINERIRRLAANGGGQANADEDAIEAEA